jgi:hypothetical protein
MRTITITTTVQFPDEAGQLFQDEAALIRFWSKVSVRGPDECWPWSGATYPAGYGQFRWGDRLQLAHRLAFRDVGGEPLASSRKVVRHTCNTPACVNPSHLVAGTQRDNIHDSMRAGTFKTVDGRLGNAANAAKARRRAR